MAALAAGLAATSALRAPRWTPEGVLEPGRVRVLSSSVAPDGRTRLVVEGRRVRVLDADGRNRAPFAGHDAPVLGAWFDPSGNVAVSVDASGNVIAWDARSGADVRRLRLPAAAYAANFSPDGARLVAGGEAGAVVLWDVRDGHVIGEWHGGAAAIDVSFSQDGRRILAAFSDGTVREWEARALAPLAVLETPRDLRGAWFTLDDRRVVAELADGRAMVWTSYGALGARLLARRPEPWLLVSAALAAVIAAAALLRARARTNLRGATP